MHQRRTRTGLRAGIAAALAAFVLLMTGGVAQAAQPVVEAGAQPAAVVQPQAAEGKTFTIGTDTAFAPFDYTDPNTGEVKGIDIDLIRAIAEAEGFTVDIKPMGFNPAVTALDSGQVDGVIAGMSITAERKKTFDFSQPYYQSGIAMAVDQDSDIASYEDMKGKKAIAKNGSEGLATGEELAKKYGFEMSSLDQSQALHEAVTSGQYSAVFDDLPVLQYAAAQGKGLKLVGDPKPAGDYGFAVKKGKNADLLAGFNSGLEKIKANGKYQAILDQYLKNPETSSASKGSIVDLAVSSWPALSKGLINTLTVTLAAFVLALVLGLLFGLLKISSSRVLRGIASVYVAVFRGTPLLVWAFFFYFGLPQLTGWKIDSFTAGMLALGLNAGAYLTEILRGSVQAVDPGQLEAARSLGLGWSKSMQRVVIPQAIKIATPSIINQFVITLKDSSLLLAITYGELLFEAQRLAGANYRMTEMLIIVGVIYFVVITLLTWVANIVDKRVNK